MYKALQKYAYKYYINKLKIKFSKNNITNKVTVYKDSLDYADHGTERIFKIR
jgi:hypothetical protein